MPLTIDGNSIVFTGTVTITNATDLTTGVATLMLTPSGGVGTIPALLAGTPGLPSLFDAVTVTTLSAGSSATASITQVSPGGAGVAAHYTMALGIPQGAAGASGTMAILSASDLENSPTANYVIGYDAGTTKAQWVPQRVGPLYIPTSISSTSGAAATRTLCSLTIPSQPYDWRPLVYGQCIVTGTANTLVNLVCRINDATAGDIVGQAFGRSGVDNPLLIPAFGSTIGGSYGKVLAGNAATIYFIATQTNGATADAWTTNSGTTSFTVEVKPIQP